MSESVTGNSGVFADSRSADLKDNENSYKNIYMNEVPETEVTRSNKTTLTSASEPSTAGCRCYRLAIGRLLMLVVLLLAAITILWVNFNNLTIERDQLQTSYNNLTTERDQSETSYKKLANESNCLKASYRNMSEERDQFQRKRDELQRSYYLKEDINTPGWVYFKSSIYFISTEKKSWNEGRQDCKGREADLVIISSREEQDFVEVWRRDKGAWIGANDSDREEVWKWVDGTAVTNGFWSSGEPNNKGDEDCAVSGYRSESVPNWVDVSCSSQYIWICEKRINSYNVVYE